MEAVVWLGLLGIAVGLVWTQRLLYERMQHLERRAQLLGAVVVAIVEWMEAVDRAMEHKGVKYDSVDAAAAKVKEEAEARQESGDVLTGSSPWQGISRR